MEQVPPRALPRSVADVPRQKYSALAPTVANVSVTKPGATTASPPTGGARCHVCRHEIKAENFVKQLECSHIFHEECADTWLRTELCCPICKTQVLFPVAQPLVFHPHSQNLGYGATGDMGEHLPLNPAAPARAVPFDGTDAQRYAACRSCQQIFYRDPRTVKPETNGWYRCPRCRETNVIEFFRGSCLIQ